MLMHALNFGVTRKNIGLLVRALSFGTVRKNIGVLVHVLNFGATWNNIGVLVHTPNFGDAQKNVGVRVHALNLALCSVHMHNKVLVVCTHIITARVVCEVWVEHIGVRLVHAQCRYMLSCDSLVNGACRVLVHGGGVLNSGMVQRVE
jgi:hypothetical protein